MSPIARRAWRRGRSPSGLVLAAALLACAIPTAPRAEVAVARVTGGDRYGAGVVWSARDGLVLTALHTVEAAAELRVSVGGAPEVPARLVEADPALDLALLRASGPLGPATPLALRSSPLVPGDRVRMLGYPRLRAVAAEARVLDPSRRFAGARYLELAGQAEPGASGGPVIDAAGAVVGIVDVVLTDRGSTLAIPIDAALVRFPVGARETPPLAPPPVAAGDAGQGAARLRARD